MAMDGFKEQPFLGTMKGMADFGRFKVILSQIHRDEIIMRGLISRFLTKPSNQLLMEIAEEESYLKAGMGDLKNLMKTNDIDGGLFCCAEVEERVAGLLEKVQKILRDNVSLHA